MSSSKGKKEVARKKKKTDAVIVVAIIGLIGTIITAVFNSSVIMTWLQESPKNTPVPSNQLVPIESLPIKVYVYESSKTDQSISDQSKNTFTKTSDSNLGTTYSHFYSFPEGEKKGAGLYFEFASPIDLTAYQYQEIQFTLIKNPTDKITLTLTDGKGTGNYNEINLNDLFTSKEAGIDINNNTYTISLQRNFPNVTIIKHIYFWVYSPETSGSVEYEVSKLSFIKP